MYVSAETAIDLTPRGMVADEVRLERTSEIIKAILPIILRDTGAVFFSLRGDFKREHCSAKWAKWGENRAKCREHKVFWLYHD